MPRQLRTEMAGQIESGQDSRAKSLTRPNLNLIAMSRCIPCRPVRPLQSLHIAMHVVIAPDKFKSSLAAPAVAAAIANGIRTVFPAARIDPCPMADGGEGTVDALVSATGGRLIPRLVTGPLPAI